MKKKNTFAYDASRARVWAVVHNHSIVSTKNVGALLIFDTREAARKACIKNSTESVKEIASINF
jgi:hypothetical protein